MKPENEKLFSDLTPEKQDERRKWVEAMRSHFANEHQRWGEGTFKNLMLADTGGVVVVATLMGQQALYLKDCWLRLSLTLFVVGVVAALFSFGHEFIGVARRLAAWDRLSRPYLNSEIPFGQLYGPEKYMANLNWVDWLVFGASVASFVGGCASAIVFLWKL